MLDKLRGSQEVAVDLEYHNYRSFGGFVCLMQISTREEDFVVDTLALREELEELNEVFTDPNVVKVCVFLCDATVQLQVLIANRYSMVRKATSFGCSKTSTSMSSTYSIPTMLPKC